MPFDTVMASVIVCQTALANSLPFSRCLLRRVRGYEGLYTPIIFTEFSLRLISSISLYTLNILSIISREITCLKPVNWYLIGERKTSSTDVIICFLIYPFMAV